jgi:hypothetical protein
LANQAPYNPPGTGSKDVAQSSNGSSKWSATTDSFSPMARTS